MRIECEVCSAAYTIDDAQLTDQPIGAQCPYCGHVRLVRRETPLPKSVGASSSFGTGAPQGAPGRSGPSGMGPGSGLERPSPGGFDLGMEAFGAPPPGLALAPSVDLDVSARFSNGSASSAPGRVRVSAASAALSADLDLEGNGASPGAASNRTSGEPRAGVSPAARCQVCGKELSDEFDKVIGLCDEHQRDSRAGQVGDAAAAEPMGSPTWYVKTARGTAEGPIPLEEVRTRIRTGDFSESDQFSSDGAVFRSMETFKELAYLAKLRAKTSTEAPHLGGPRAPIHARHVSAFSRIVAPSLLLVILGGSAVLGFVKREEIAKLFSGMGARRDMASMPNPLKRSIAMWRKVHQDASGTAHEHLKAAVAKHAEDTVQGYQSAEEEFRRALLLDEEDVVAIAGYVENMAIWRYGMASEEELRTANAAIRYAQAIAPQNGAVHRAQGALALAAGDLNGCRVGADRAVEKDRTDARAKLILAGCFLEGNVLLSTEEAERALELMPELRRADRVLAEAYGHLGRYASAFRVLDARMKRDRDNLAVVVLYGHLARGLGEFGLAEESYRRAVTLKGDVYEALMALGELELERGDFAGAARDFKKATEIPNLPSGRLVIARVAWARAELERRNAAQARSLATLALETDPKDAAAHIIVGEAALLAGSATTAVAAAKRALEIRPDEPAALVLSGRAMFLAKGKQAGFSDLQQAVTNDPQDPRLKGILAAAYLKTGGAPQAFALMRKASDVDPRMAESRKRISRFGLTSVSVREAIPPFEKVSSDERDGAVAIASVGLLYYHLRDTAQAQAALGRALKLDAGNFTALVYSAELALDRGDADAALADARKLLSVERGNALGYLLLGRALAMKGRTEEAKEQLEAALRADQSLTGARVELGLIALQTGEQAAAMAMLRAAFDADPWRIDVRRALRKAGY